MDLDFVEGERGIIGGAFNQLEFSDEGYQVENSKQIHLMLQKYFGESSNCRLYK